MTVKSTHQTKVPMRNFMEELADESLRSILSKSGQRGKRFSEGAVNDIKALALNRLWPMYVTTTTGQDFLRKMVEEDQVRQDVLRELHAAIAIVQAKPRN